LLVESRDGIAVVRIKEGGPSANRIDEAAVDVEVAWDARAMAERAVIDAEIATAAAIERLLDERLAVMNVVQLTGLDHATVRRLRQLAADTNEVDSRGEHAGTELA
jgi:hypothetical protein